MIVRALALVWRRLWLYAAAAAATIGAQALVVFAWRVPHGISYAGAVFPALLTALVYAFVWNDTDESPRSAAAAWERVLERAWVVILIDLVLGILVDTGLGGVVTGDPVNVALGIVVFAVAVPLVFADVSATVDDMPVWWLLPGALWRSMRIARGPLYLRAVVILALNLVAILAGEELAAWMQASRVPNGDFWALIPLNAIATVPIAALTALVYRDATRKTETEAAGARSGD